MSLHEVILLSMVCVVASIPLQSGLRRTHAGDVKHLYVAPARGSVTWSPELAEDFVLPNYNREAGELIGYQRSSKLVVAQHSVKHAHTEAMDLHDAVILGCPVNKPAGCTSWLCFPAKCWVPILELWRVTGGKYKVQRWDCSTTNLRGTSHGECTALPPVGGGWLPSAAQATPG